MTVATLLSFLVTTILIEITPGPNMGYLSVVSATKGAKAALAVVAGIACGLFTVGIATAVGIGALIEATPVLYQVVRFAGVGYLLWLAWEGWRDADKPINESLDRKSSEPGLYFRHGLLTNLLNPKAFLFYVATLPQFLPQPHASPASIFASEAWDASLLTCLYVMVATAIHIIIVVMSASVHGFLVRPERRRLIQRVMAIALAGLALWLLTGTRH